MMNEKKILAAILQSRPAWESINDKIADNEFSPESGIILALAKEFYDNDISAQKCDVEILSSRAERNIQHNKTIPIVTGAIRDLGQSDISAINVAKEVLELKKSNLGNRIASKLAAGRYEPLIKDWMNDYLELDQAAIQVGEGSQSEDDETFRGTKAADLVRKTFSPEGLIQLYPMAVNRKIDGGLRSGHNVLVVAPTEMGKTLFTINACYGFLKQGFSVLYVGNEDPAPDILMRMINRLTGMNKYQVMENPDEADTILSRRNWDLFTFANLSPGNFIKISSLVNKYKPAVLVLDQLRNIDVGIDQRTQSLERAATEARNLAKRLQIRVISVTQAADSASGKTVLDRGDIDGSNVGIPSQMDLIIAMGATPEMEQTNWRTLSFPKNKLSGDHIPITVQIDPLLSRIVE